MWAYEQGEDWMGGERVFGERSEVCVAIVLDTGGEDEEGKREDCTDRRRGDS